tara:strand:+ start:5047 stop:6267 length:1221 start_codon:yes stop_codon:yes gene_type:complete
MAKQKSREIQSLKELKFGSTNVMELRADQPSLPQRNRASNSDILSQVNLGSFTPDLIKGKVEYNGIVLRSTECTHPIASSEIQKTFAANQLGGSDTGAGGPYYVYKVMIPELHSYLPAPLSIAPDKGVHQGIINTYPDAATMVGKNFGDMPPGQIVRVQFEQTDVGRRPIVVHDTGVKLLVVSEESKGKYFAQNRASRVDIFVEPTEEDWIFPLNMPDYEWNVTSCFGQRYQPVDKKCKFHGAVDLTPKKSQGFSGLSNAALRNKYSTGQLPLIEILAATDGVVVQAGNRRGYGFTVTIWHENKEDINKSTATLYAHMAYKPQVKQGEYVSAGDIIGIMGTTGKSTGPHLHFEVWENAAKRPGTTGRSGTRTDPLQFLKNKGVAMQFAEGDRTVKSCRNYSDPRCD